MRTLRAVASGLVREANGAPCSCAGIKFSSPSRDLARLSAVLRWRAPNYESTIHFLPSPFCVLAKHMTICFQSARSEASLTLDCPVARHGLWNAWNAPRILRRILGWVRHRQIPSVGRAPTIGILQKLGCI